VHVSSIDQVAGKLARDEGPPGLDVLIEPEQH
jgi:hypothetical protein